MGNPLHQGGALTCRFDDRGEPSGGIGDELAAASHLRLALLDQRLDLRGGFRRRLGEAPDLDRDDGKALSGFARSCRFDRGV